MNQLPVRLAVATLALLVGSVVCAEALILSLQPGVSLATLVQPTAALLLLAFAGVGFAYAHTRALVEELSLLCDQLRLPGARLSVLPEARFHEAQVLRDELSHMLSSLRSIETQRDTERVKTDAPLALRIRFVAAMGHDLRTPLNAMLGFADLLALDRTSSWNTQQQRSLAILRDRTRDLLALIDLMIDWAKLESGELGFSPHACSALSLIERALDVAKQRSGGRGLRTRVELPAGLGTAYVDEERTVQALVGLMDHAARTDNNPELVVRAASTASVPRALSQSGAVVIEIIDPQLDIREPDRANLFRAFRVSFGPTGRRIGGLGLGSATARALLRAQGGDVWFDSRPERGTTFVIALPSHASSAVVSAAASTSAASASATKKSNA